MLVRLLRSLWKNEPVTVIRDELRAFFSTEELAKVVGICLDAYLARAGIYHISNGTQDSYFSFANTTARIFRCLPTCLRPVSGAEFAHSGLGFANQERGKDLTLNGQLFMDTFSFAPRSTEEMLDRIRSRLIKGEQ